MAQAQKTFCVLTRAQDSELPFFNAFAHHYLDRAGFGKVFVIYCDSRDPSFFIDEVRKCWGSKVEVLYSPDNVIKGVNGCLNLYVDRIKLYDYCFSADIDEILFLPSGKIDVWLKEQGYPRSALIPWVNVLYFGQPVNDYADMLRYGTISLRNLGKSVFRTDNVIGISPHNAIFASSSSEIQENEKRIRWERDAGRLSASAGAIHDLRQSSSTSCASAQLPTITFVENDAYKFCFVLHFNARGVADLISKTLFQHFNSSRKVNNLYNPKLFQTSDFSALTLDEMPSRFTYAFEEKRRSMLSPHLENRLREVAAERLGSLPLNINLQKRLFLEGLAKIGLNEERAEEVWTSDFMMKLFQHLDDQFGPRYAPEQADHRRRLAKQLREFFDNEFAGRDEFKKWARIAIKDAEQALEFEGLRDEERDGAILTLAREQLNANRTRLLNRARRVDRP